MTEVDAGGEAQGGNAAALAATVLEEEAARQDAQARAKEQVIFPDDLLPGVNSEPVSFKQAFAAGGKRMFIILGLLLALDELESAGLYALGPEIARSLGVSKGTIVFIGGTSAAFFVLGAVPMGWLADRVRRVPIIGTASLVFA
ncbi:MAG TPA: ABC transporter, partial [Acidimicrobiia bacterium]|nr:ABC transporter [Acidimicrobiia bacterium]